MTANSTLDAAVRGFGGGIAIVLAVIALSSCSASSGGAQSTAPSPPPASTTVTTTSSPTSSPTASPKSGAASAANRSGRASASAKSSPAGSSGCADSQLGLTSRGLPGATSHGGLLIIFTNRSNHTCSLFGYPGAAALNAAGTQIVQAERTLQGFLGSCGCSAPARVVLKPGDAASAVVEGSNGGGDECLRGKAVLVTPPNTRKSTKFPFEDYSCSLQVHPVTAGTKTHLPS